MKTLNEIIKSPVPREIIRSATMYTRDPDSFKNIMRAEKFYKIGDGTFSEVFKNDKYGWLIKIFSKKDTGYQAWYGFMKSHQHNKYVPKIRGSMISLNEKFFAVRFEELDNDMSEKLPDTFNVPLKAMIRYAAVNPYFEQHADSMDDVLKRYQDSYDEIPDRGLIGWKANKDIKEVITFLAAHSGNLDLGFSNVMLRGRQPVITDPIQ